MNSSKLKDSRYLAGCMETRMQWIAGISACFGLFALLTQGLSLGVAIFLLAALAYGLGKLFSVAANAIEALDRLANPPGQPPQDSAAEP